MNKRQERHKIIVWFGKSRKQMKRGIQRIQCDTKRFPRWRQIKKAYKRRVQTNDITYQYTDCITESNMTQNEIKYYKHVINKNIEFYKKEKQTNDNKRIT